MRQLEYPFVINNPDLRGEPAAPKQLFGEHGRYAFAPVHTRFTGIEWQVWDAGTVDPLCDAPALIRQLDSVAELQAFVEQQEKEAERQSEIFFA